MNNTAIRKYGLIAGVLMALFLGGLSILGDFSGSPLKYFKYVLLMAVMYTFYHNYRSTYVRRSYILNHIAAGARMSMYAAVVIVIANTILYLIDPAFSAAKYYLIPKDGFTLLLVDLTIFIESFVLGVISSFILFPLFKPKVKEVEQANRRYESSEVIESR